MKILTAFAAVLSINVAAAELVVYEGTADIVVVFDPLNLIPIESANHLRIRLIVDAATLPYPNPPGPPHIQYENLVRDFSLWLDGVPYPLPPTTNNNVLRTTDEQGLATVDTFSLYWLGLEDGVYSRLRLDIDTSETATHIGAAWLDISRHPQFRTVSGIHTIDLTSFTITPLSVPNLLARLLTASEGVGPGKSLANKVILAQTYYAVPDLVSTCAVLGEYVTQTAHKKVPAAQGAALAEDARLIGSAVGCAI